MEVNLKLSYYLTSIMQAYTQKYHVFIIKLMLFTDADTDASDDYVDDVCSSNEENETVYQSVVDPDVPLIEQE